MAVKVALGVVFFYVLVGACSVSSWKAGGFHWATSDNGEVLCGMSTPNLTLNAVESRVRCIASCYQGCVSTCHSANYWKTSRLCEVFYYEPCSYDVQSDCANYQNLEKDKNCSETADACHANATCSLMSPEVCVSERPIVYKCVCNQGFVGDGIDCQDIDECASNNGGCSSLAVCSNAPGGFTCTCRDGFIGDGYNCSGSAQMFSKSGRRVILSTTGILDVVTFLLVSCRAWDTVAEDVRPRCFSLMDASRTGWYVRHWAYNLRVDSEGETSDLPLFQQDSSFILHVDSFYPGYYALESINHVSHYARMRDDGSLWVEPDDYYTSAYADAASFQFYAYSMLPANCSIEVLTYSANGFANSCTPKEGRVKVNGVPAWQAAWCANGIFPDLRGVNTLLVDPFNCYVQESRHFDTHVSASNAIALSNYLQQLSSGSIIVGVSADEPRTRLDDALATLQQLGVEVSDVQIRGSFAFIVQKGFLVNTVLRKVLTEAESYSNPAQFNAAITGSSVDNLSITVV